jgi:hypothetical protein
MKRQIIKSDSAFVCITNPLDRSTTRQRTNILFDSESFNNWTLLGDNRPTITETNVNGPFNTQTAEKITFGVSANSRVEQQGRSISTAGNYVFSIWLRADSPQIIYIGFNSAEQRCDVTTEWKRFFKVWANRPIGSIYPQIQRGIAGASPFSFYAWGAQVESGTSPTRYIKTTNSSLTVSEYLEKPRLFSLVQNCNFSIENDRQKLRQIGSQDYCINNLIKAPNVDLSFDYYLSPYLNNELLMGFKGENTLEENAFADLKKIKNNFYLVIDNKDGRDGLDLVKKQGSLPSSFSGFDVLSFGDSYLKNYSLNFSNNAIPIVSVKYSCSNMKFDNLNNNLDVSTPSINQNGSINTSGFFDLPSYYSGLVSGYISGDLNNRTEFNPPVSLSNNSIFTLEDLQVGGVALSSGSQPILQSFGLSINFDRVDLYGLGSNYIFNRKLQYPINANVTIESLVSGFNAGEINKLFTNESGYNFIVSCSDQQKYTTSKYKFENAKLENFNYSLTINNIMKFQASFNVEITDKKGFYINRKTIYADKWNDIYDLWNNLNIAWNLV